MSPEADRSSPLAAALAEARRGFEPIQKNRTVKVKPKDTAKPSYTFKYATFDVLLAATLPALAMHGISVLQSIEDETHSQGSRMVLATYLIHSSGEERRVTVPFLMPGYDNAQAVGSALSYARRYGFSMALCLAAEEDDDGNSADGNEVEEMKEVKRAPAKPAKPDNKPEPSRRTPELESIDSNWKRAEKAIKRLEEMGLVDGAVLDGGDGGIAREAWRGALMKGQLKGQPFDRKNPEHWKMMADAAEAVVQRNTPPAAPEAR